MGLAAEYCMPPSPNRLIPFGDKTIDFCVNYCTYKP